MLAAFFEKMPQDVDAGYERPYTVRDHERDNAVRVRVGKKPKGAQKIERVVPKALRAHEAPLIAGKCNERKKRGAYAEDFYRLHSPIVPCVGGGL